MATDHPEAATAVRAPGLWERIWFPPETALNLAAARIVIAAHALWVLLSRDLPAISGLPEPFWNQVSTAARFRFLIFEGNLRLEQWLEGLAILALFLTMIGLLARPAAFAAGLLLYHLAPFETILWTSTASERGFTISVLALLTLSFSRCDEALAVSDRPARTRPRARPWEYGWALRLLWLYLAGLYFFSGYSKIFRGGIEWISGENIRRWLLLLNQQDQLMVFSDLGPWIAERPALCWAIAVATILIELAFPLVLISAAARRLFIPVMAVGHIGIYFAMNIAFLNVPQLLIFVNWSRLRRRLWPSGPS